jgi:hypothetical protein
MPHLPKNSPKANGLQMCSLKARADKPKARKLIQHTNHLFPCGKMQPRLYLPGYTNAKSSSLVDLAMLHNAMLMRVNKL